MSGSPDPSPAAAGRRGLVAIARHAQPEGGDGRKRFVGQADAPLGTVGIEQARRLADRLAPLGLEAIYCSDLRRCASTTRIVAERVGLPVFVEPQLREIDTGLWEGLTADEAKQRFPAEYVAREADLLGHPFPAGESFRDLERRVVPAFEAIRGQGGEKILIIAHLGVNRVLLCRLRGLPLESLFSIRQDYCGGEFVGLDASAGAC